VFHPSEVVFNRFSWRSHQALPLFQEFQSDQLRSGFLTVQLQYNYLKENGFNLEVVGFKFQLPGSSAMTA